MTMADPAFDLWFDPNTVGADLVVETWISHGPRRDDPGFDPKPGDGVLVGDDDDEPLAARVIGRDADRVTVRVELPSSANAVA